MADLSEVSPGANMENCPRCTDPNPDYPWICPGHPAETIDDERLTAAPLVEPENVTAANLAHIIADHTVSDIQQAFRMLGMRLTFELVEDEAAGEPETQLCELPHATIEEEDACERNRLARAQTPQEGTT